MKADLGSPIQAAAVFLSGRDRGEWGASPALRVGVLQPALVLASSAALAWRGLQRLNRRLPMETWCVYPLLFQGA